MDRRRDGGEGVNATGGSRRDDIVRCIERTKEDEEEKEGGRRTAAIFRTSD